MAGLAPAAYEDFVLANTEIVTPPLVPEIRLRLATAMVPIWEATEAALARLGVEPPYWAFAWPGGQAIARYLLDHPGIVAGSAVLDLAAGSGLAAIAAALAGARPVIANDIDPLALVAIRLNAELNGVRVTADGSDRLAAAAVPGSNAGERIILAGDVCYECGFADRIWAWLRAEAAAGALVLLGDPGRSYLPGAGLAPLARYPVPTSRDLEDRDVRPTTVWRVL